MQSTTTLFALSILFKDFNFQGFRVEGLITFLVSICVCTKQYVLHTMLLLKPPNFKYKLFFSNSLPLANVQFDLGSGFASSSLPNVASLFRFGSNVRSVSLPSHFSTSTSSNQSNNAKGSHVPCDPTNASTIGASSFANLGTLGATSFVEFQGTLGVVNFAKLQGTLGVTNSTSLCSSSCKGAYSIQGLTSGTQGPIFGT
jgi:hypothetical protein